MLKSKAIPLPATLTGSLREYRMVEGANLLTRVQGFYDWQNQRFRDDVWPYSRATDAGPRTACAVSDDLGRITDGEMLPAHC